MAEFLARVHVGHMYLHAGQAHSRNRIADGVAVVRVRTGVHDDRIAVLTSRVNTVDQRTLGVGLEYRAFHPQTFALLYNLRIDGCQRVRTINARFALTGQVQVRTVDQ